MSLKASLKFGIATGLALLLLSTLAPAAQAQVSGKPVEKDEIIPLLNNQADVAEVVRAARQFGINFAMTREIEAELRQAGKDQPAAELENLIRVLRGMALSQVDILGLVVETESSQYLARLVRKRGIDFQVSEKFLQELRDAGGEKVLEDALRSAILVPNVLPKESQQVEAQVVQHIYQGLQFEKKRQFPQAGKEYRAALALQTQNPVLHMVLGHLLLVHGKKDEEEAEFRTALQLWPSSPVAHCAVGISLFAKGFLDAAIAEQRVAIRLDPEYADAHGNLGAELVQKGDFDAGIVELRTAARIDPQRVGWRIRIAVALLTKDDRRDEAIAELRDVLRSRPDYAEAHMFLGQGLGLKKDWDQAITEERTALTLDPNLVGAYLVLGDALVMKHDFDQALSEFRKAVQLAPNVAVFHFLLGVALEHKKDLQGASDEYAKAKQLDPKNPQIQAAYDEVQTALQLGSSKSGAAPSGNADLITLDDLEKLHDAEVLVNGGRADEAIPKLQGLIRLKPNYIDAHLWLGIAFAQKRDWDNDIVEQRAALRLNPSLAQAHAELGVALTWKNDWDHALSELRSAVQLAPADARAHYILANVLNHQKDLAGALDEYSKAKQLDPKNQLYQKAYNDLKNTLGQSKASTIPAPTPGEAGTASASTVAPHVSLDAATKRQIQSALDYLTKNDLESALSEARAAVLAAPNSGEAHHLLGQVYERRNELPAAMREYTQARDLDPKDSTIQIAIDRVQNALDHSKHSSTSGVGGGSVPETPSWFAPDRLDGIYVARETGYAHWYYFKPSGAVALDCDQILVDPDEALAWPTYKIYVEINAEEKGYRPVDCSLGQYRLQGDQIRFNALAFSVDPSRRTKFREGAFEGQKDRKGDERLQTIRGFDVIQIVKAVPLPGVDPNYSRTWVLDRQSDQTGRRLEGEYFNLVMSAPVGTLSTGTAGRANFSPDGQFSLAVETAWEGNAAASPHPGGRLGNGTYEIQGHTIIFHNSDGTVSTRNFGYLGKDNKGREFIAIGGFIWVKGDIFSE